MTALLAPEAAPLDVRLESTGQRHEYPCTRFCTGLISTDHHFDVLVPHPDWYVLFSPASFQGTRYVI